MHIRRHRINAVAAGGAVDARSADVARCVGKTGRHRDRVVEAFNAPCRREGGAPVDVVAAGELVQAAVLHRDVAIVKVCNRFIEGDHQNRRLADVGVVVAHAHRHDARRGGVNHVVWVVRQAGVREQGRSAGVIVQRGAIEIEAIFDDADAVAVVLPSQDDVVKLQHIAAGARDIAGLHDGVADLERQ